jgi:hypothetical protein
VVFFFKMDASYVLVDIQEFGASSLYTVVTEKGIIFKTFSKRSNIKYVLFNHAFEPWKFLGTDENSGKHWCESWNGRTFVEIKDTCAKMFSFSKEKKYDMTQPIDMPDEQYEACIKFWARYIHEEDVEKFLAYFVDAGNFKIADVLVEKFFSK